MATLSWPEQKLSQSLSCLKKPFYMPTLLMWPDYCGPFVTILAELHCNTIYSWLLISSTCSICKEYHIWILYIFILYQLQSPTNQVSINWNVWHLMGLPQCKNLWIFSLFRGYCLCAQYCFGTLCCLAHSLFYVTGEFHRFTPRMSPFITGPGASSYPLFNT